MSSHQHAGQVSKAGVTLEPVQRHAPPTQALAPVSSRPPGRAFASRKVVAAVLVAGDIVALWLTAAVVGDAHAWLMCALLVAVTTILTPRRVTLDLRVDAVLGPMAGVVMVAALSLATIVPPEGGILQVTSIAIVAVALSRATSHAGLRNLRRRGLLRDQVLVYGAGDVAAALIGHFDATPGLGLDPVVDLTGRVRDGADTRNGPADPAGDLGHVIVTAGADNSDALRHIRTIVASGVSVFLVPHLPELAPFERTSRTEEVGGIPLMRLRPAPQHTMTWALKRLMDRVVAAAGLVVFSPLLLGIALAIRLGDAGPVLFRQVRVGLGGQEFEILKFRTMAVNPDSDVTWSVHHDDRITPTGRVLRRTNLDELPQLLNVLRGEMSLVGPRPERPFFTATFTESIPSYADRHRVPVGVTGLAQVHGFRGDTSIAERARLDNRYIDDWSLWRDCMILFRTAGQLIRRGSE